MEKERIGRYEIEKRLGAGSMAVVYKAIDPVIGRTVAIKTIKIDSSMGFEQEELRQRLYHEAQSAGQLNHPNIVTIYDIGAEGNVDYIAMEFVEGESLSEWMVKNPIPPIQQTVSIIEQIASGLDYAAARGVIHRDIKPANILLTADMTAKIADFGIAKIATSKFTQTGAVIGSPSYMSPEQAMGKTLDGRSDIFSLGIIFYEMLTGEKPFNGTNPTTIIYKILHEEPVLPQKLNVTLHPAFNEIVARMLAKDPDIRYQNCSQLIPELKNYSSMTVRENKPQPPVSPVAIEPKSSGRNRVAALIILLVVAIAAGAGYHFFWKPRQDVLRDTATIKNPQIPPAMTENGAKNTNPVIPPNTEPRVLPEQKSAADNQQKSDDRAKPGTKAKDAVSQVPETALAKKETRQPASGKVNPAVTENLPPAGKRVLPAEESGQAEIRLVFAGATYPVSIYDGAVLLKDLSAANSSIRITAGNHHFKLVSEDGFVEQTLAPGRLKADEVFTISVPAVCSAFIDVPNDTYEGCVIQLDGKTISAPYPAQIPKLAAGNHKIVFRWNSGKHIGKEIVSGFTSEANHHYSIRGEPDSEKVTVRQIR
jgi:serine/threonine protein kinase